jgi:RNA polymerase sigma factor (sigma-70 family)
MDREEELALARAIHRAWRRILRALREGRHVLTALLGEGAASLLVEAPTEQDIVDLQRRLSAKLKRRRGRVANGLPSRAAIGELRRRLDEGLSQFRPLRDQMIRRNLRLVLSVARGFRGRGLGSLDLVQEGTLGLMRAIEKYDPERGVKFGTYAVWWIRQAMARALDNRTDVVRVPIYLQTHRRRLARLSRALEEELQREPTATELFAAGRKTIRARALAESPPVAVPLEAPLGDTDDRRLEEVLPDPAARTPEEEVTRGDTESKLRALVGRLAERDSEILRLRYGLEGRRIHTLQEVGARLSVSRERIRQLEGRALARLKKVCQEEGLVPSP